MRLWSIHPKYLDTKGLVALWREALLAQAVLRNKTRGYKNHPQLSRFRNTKNPCAAIAAYLGYISDEAHKRGYTFDRAKIKSKSVRVRIPVTKGQIKYELEHLRRKLWKRDRRMSIKISPVRSADVHPIFVVISGSVEEWERP